MRILLRTALVAACVVAASGIAAADGFVPSKPVSIVVHAGPGGANDVFGRQIINVIEKEKLSPVRFVMVNKTGGGSVSAMNFVTAAKGDNDMIALFASNWTSDHIVQKEAENSLQGLTPIANLIVEPALVVVRADSPYKTLKDFIDAAKASPNTLKQSGGSPIGRDAVVRYLLMANTGAKWHYISFQGGGERISALLGGHTDMYVLDATEAGDLIRSGQLRALAQVSDTRIPGFPDVPTIREAGYAIDIPVQARGVVGPPGMSKEAVAFYQDLFAKMVQTPTWKKYIADNQLENRYIPGDQLKEFLAGYAEQMKKILTDAGIQTAR
ncbi:tripartite tricarboxylate transporter substrate binding protein [Ancylobacter sp. MQZ15Z-1]|uniref:Tripartite tricarboxylate transporter substrate binding protein n=1 Tax=Ancylobacter mangrovi TaxID=2972472 RepID=A0A9X2PJ44_9HYPH|nr:tripartite tricarboxylate transporter substrate binding protein [Ancylobacter mangrovi]MCS0497193.1 tripartite tricarboxylate transporter substrate binding protein [Ancylobacter mangrovi]